ncbi:N-acetylmuramic acid 6-phosphate etherase [Microbacterium marinilacus]|uniref:N-acetylmuramic acid 6-phosphate etherase n=1 Tax=Microbacterium marinilacus TaxID=415209 RepID=A0ABP7BBF6_9MICO|nr:N-acetylmuramic acid 6-phosphate etherase [Microbacterium marinilacus]MBY0687237.1 N-acetylmuramic acid 6-phosphate etherase [Microbacterium marinilacus]
MATLDSLTTEAADPRYADIDTLGVAELAALMNEADRGVPLAVRDALPQIVPAIEAVTDRMLRGGRLFYVGAGTPGRIGVLDASEIPPTFSTRDRVIGIMAGGPRAIVEAIEGAEDDAAAGATAIDQAGVGPLDSVVGIAASGRTPFVIGAVTRARERGALGVGLSCNADTELSRAADHGIEVITGPELVSGSTRLKAGTAQKLVLNMFSTISMVRLGKTYGNLMVDVRASNAKLRVRAERIVSRVAGVAEDVARARLEESGYSVPVAVVAIRRGLPIDAARAALDAAGGRLRAALDDEGRASR